jgi:putative salt-induced outer membrane protein YdiY
LLAEAAMKKLVFVVLFALPAFAQEPAKPWNSSLGAGLALTSGNTDTQNYNLSFNSKYDPKTRIIFKADALYLRAVSDGEKNVDKALANVRLEDSLSDRLFGFGEISYLRDPFKDLNSYVAPLVGAGYRIIKSDPMNLAVDGAVGAVFESHVLDGRDTSGAVKAGENFDYALSATSKITQKLTGIWKMDDFGDSLMHFDAGIATAVVTKIELKVAYTYDYKTRVPSSDIKKGDSALFVAFLYKF